MSTETRPSRRATDRPGLRPSRVGVARSRWVEAEAIVEALSTRLAREERELTLAPASARASVLGRVRVTSLELADAVAYEARSYRALGHEAGLSAVRRVAGVRSGRRPGNVPVEGGVLSGRLERRLLPAERVDATQSRRQG